MNRNSENRSNLGHIATTGEWLGLSREDELLNETKAEFIAMLRAARSAGNITQAELARRVGMFQPAIARLENGGPATLDVLFRCLLAAGVASGEIASGMARAAAIIEIEAENNATALPAKPRKVAARRAPLAGRR